MKRFLLFYFLLPVFAANAGDITYPVDAIPGYLKKGANAVKRMEEFRLRIVSTREAVMVHRYAVTILNEEGEAHAVLIEYYDKLQKIVSIEGALYDASGARLKKMRMKDASDLSAADDHNLVDDDRKKVHRFFYKSYPYTVEYEVETKFNHTLFFPAWFPQDEELLSVEQSSYAIVCPSNYNIRYRAFNYNDDPAIHEEKGQKSMKWEVKGLEGMTMPFGSPPLKEVTTIVYFAPAEFEIQGYKGTMNTWHDFGKFQYSLNANRDQLPSGTVETVKQLTAGLTGEKEKVRVLYNFLQKNTRYISIQLGLGGWQPLDARFVAEKGYGDCKALTNYMHSLLKAAGIKSNYVLIFAGEEGGDHFIEDFPSKQFNHAILCVPLAQDTIWLECTSQTAPSGYLGGFTGNRKAVLITENGGVIVSTPRYGIKENFLVRNVHAGVEDDGNLKMKVRTQYGGLRQDDLVMRIHARSKDEVLKMLQEEFQFSTYQVLDFKYEEVKLALPLLDEELDIAVSGYATISGKRMFITPNILNRSSTVLEIDENRKVDFVLNPEWRDEDSYEIEIPDGYEPEAIPQDVRLKTKFGTYSCSAKLTGNKIVYRRVREQFSGRFPAKDQAELARFFEEIYKADRSRVVLVKRS